MNSDGVESVLGYQVQTGDAELCIECIADHIANGATARWLACMNPHSYAVATSRPSFRSALQGADWLVPDGAGIVMASKLLGGSIRGRVTGSDIFFGLHDRLQEKGDVSVFFLGSTASTLTTIRTRMNHDWPRVRVAGVCSPPFKPAFSERDLHEMVSAINEAQPDIVWVGLTAPKQEELIFRAIDRLDVQFVAAIGAVFDFYAGNVRRSHPFFRRHGLEWLPRLLQEPRRLWRRMFVSAPIFVWHVFRVRMARSFAGKSN